VELARLTVPPGQYIIGRERDSQIFVNTPLLSRRHARLTIEANRILIEDLGSSNGTFINDQPVIGASQLRPNQAVRFGDITLEIRQHAPVEPAASPYKPAPTVVAPVQPLPKAARAAAPQVARRPAAPVPAPRTAAGKSKMGLYGGIGVAVVALGVAAYFFWPRQEKLTRAQLYALAHPHDANEPISAATPPVVAKPANAPHPPAPTPAKTDVKSVAEKKPVVETRKATPAESPAAVEKTNDPAAQAADDATALAEAKQRRLDLLVKFQFAEARTAIMLPILKTEKARDEQDVLTRKATWLADFKLELIEDLNAKGCTQALLRKSGEKLTGAVVHADEEHVVLRESGTTVPWTDLSLESVFEMAASFIPRDMPPEMAAFRKWHLGAFAFFAGKKDEGLRLLEEAAKARPIYKTELPLFENATGPY
jgi:hypothetical protein